jgi:hypothetical protein
MQQESASFSARFCVCVQDFLDDSAVYLEAHQKGFKPPLCSCSQSLFIAACALGGTRLFSSVSRILLSFEVGVQLPDVVGRKMLAQVFGCIVRPISRFIGAV